MYAPLTREGRTKEPIMNSQDIQLPTSSLHALQTLDERLYTATTRTDSKKRSDLTHKQREKATTAIERQVSSMKLEVCL